MFWDQFDTAEKIELVFTLIVIAVALPFWWLNRNASRMERWKMLARYGDTDLEVAWDDDANKRVCFCYQYEYEGSTQEERFLITAKRAGELAQMLRIAASRGSTIGVARWHYRHDREGPKPSSPG